MTILQVALGGVGAWTADCHDWPTLRDALARGREPATPTTATRPVARSLPAAERRRVPDGVAVALEVAREALSTSDVGDLASVFASAYADLAIVDYLCSTLASDPKSLSPTRFHHSVHNAASGYWTMATPSHGPSTAIAARDETVAVGLIEAASQVATERRPVLLVLFDTPAVGLLVRATPNARLFGAALLLTPPADAGTRLSMSIETRAVGAPLPRARAFHALARSSPAASAVALLEALSRDDDTAVDYPLGASSTLAIRVAPPRR